MVGKFSTTYILPSETNSLSPSLPSPSQSPDVFIFIFLTRRGPTKRPTLPSSSSSPSFIHSHSHSHSSTFIRIHPHSPRNPPDPKRGRLVLGVAVEALVGAVQREAEVVGLALDVGELAAQRLDLVLLGLALARHRVRRQHAVRRHQLRHLPDRRVQVDAPVAQRLEPRVQPRHPVPARRLGRRRRQVLLPPASCEGVVVTAAAAAAAAADRSDGERPVALVGGCYRWWRSADAVVWGFGGGRVGTGPEIDPEWMGGAQPWVLLIPGDDGAPALHDGIARRGGGGPEGRSGNWGRRGERWRVLVVGARSVGKLRGVGGIVSRDAEPGWRLYPIVHWRWCWSGWWVMEEVWLRVYR